MLGSDTLLALLIFTGIFVVSLVITLVLWRHWANSQDEESNGAREEAENLRARAEANAKGAADLESRAKRLEHLLAVQRRTGRSGR